MKNAVMGFVAGALSASAAFNVLQREHFEPAQVDRDVASLSTPGTQVIPWIDPTSTERPAPSAPSIVKPSLPNNSFAEASDARLAPGGSLLRVAERSLEYWTENKDRFDVFSQQFRNTSPAGASLENSVTNEVWRVAGVTLSPAASVTECRPTACRVRLSYGTNALLNAAMQSNFDLRMLESLESFGFVATDKAPEWDHRALDPDPEAAGEALDIYFWRESQGAQ